jgi:outer membrane murein-binding lipoprotein Lpp
MDNDLTPRAAESIPVVLARMEGKLDRVNDKVDNIVPRVQRLEDRVDMLENDTLVLKKDAEAEEAKKIALALALKEADETRRNQSEQTWTPVQRFMAVLGVVAAVVTLGIYLYATIHG